MAGGGRDNFDDEDKEMEKEEEDDNDDEDERRRRHMRRNWKMKIVMSTVNIRISRIQEL